MMRVPVPREVADGIKAVRRSGLTNMLDRPRVSELADELGFEAAAEWIREHRDLYARLVFHGFTVEDPPPESGPASMANHPGT